MGRSGYRTISTKAPHREPLIRALQRKDGSGWFVFVDWGDRPAEQVGGFICEQDAQAWIENSVPDWLRKRFEHPDLRLNIR